MNAIAHSAIDLDGMSGARIAFVQACWHKEIVDAGRDGFLGEIARLGLARSAVELFDVAGSYDIPLLAKRLAASGRHAAIVAAGLIVDGGIYRHDFVAQAVISGLMQVQLETDVPIISMVLTPHHFHQHEEHADFFREHFLKKGAEAAQALAHSLRALAKAAA